MSDVNVAEMLREALEEALSDEYGTFVDENTPSRIARDITDALLNLLAAASLLRQDPPPAAGEEAKARQSIEWLRDLDRPGRRYNCECQVGGVDAMSVDTDWLLARVRDLAAYFDTTPAPVSSPAGEDVERVARVLDPSAFNPTASVPICFGQTPESAREEAQEAARDEARRVLAALSARPVEAQGTDGGEGPLLAQAWAAEARKEREAHAAALARAEAAEAEKERWHEAALIGLGAENDLRAERDALRAVVEAVRALADGWRADGPTDTEPGLAIFLDRLRALLDGDSEGRESGQAVAQEGLPCDGGCSVETGGPAEDCSRHGRPVREVWEALATVQAREAAALARAEAAEGERAKAWDEGFEAGWAAQDPDDHAPNPYRALLDGDSEGRES